MKTNYPTKSHSRRASTAFNIMNPNFPLRLPVPVRWTTPSRFELGRLWDPTLLDRLQVPLTRHLD
jgi:hypothetical protein